MTPTEFQLRQYVIRLKGLALHYIPSKELKAYDGLFDAIDATLEEMDRKDWRKVLAG
jgi:hypothetical protein